MPRLFSSYLIAAVSPLFSSHPAAAAQGQSFISSNAASLLHARSARTGQLLRTDKEHLTAAHALLFIVNAPETNKIVDSNGF
jgi:hypothetical protein